MERVHVDFFEFKGKQFLIMIDAFSKYIWTHVMNAETTTLKTLAILYGWFCDRNGFPTTLVSDNGPQFTAHEFGEKMAKWGIKHLLTPPYHPASNGLAEKAVGIVKTKLKKMDCPATPIEIYVNLQAALRVYRATPHSSTGQTPFELISNAAIPVMFPQLQSSQQKIQEANRSSLPKDRVRQVRKFKVGDSVLVYNTQTKMNSHGLVKQVKSNNSYIVNINDCDKHISSDMMRLSENNSDSNQLIMNNNNDSNSLVKNDNDEYFSDNDSNFSEENDEYTFTNNSDRNFILANDNNHRIRKTYRSEIDKLSSDFTVNLPESRIRSGKV